MCKSSSRAEKWYVQELESLLENRIHKIVKNFETQTDQPIVSRRLELVFINKKKTYLVDFVVSSDQKVKIKKSGNLEK